MRIQRVMPSKAAGVHGDEDLSLVEPLIEKYKNRRGSMIPLLQGAQNIYGYLPRLILEKISKDANLNLSDIFGVATFYSQFRLNPVGKNIIKVCHGTACHVQNANSITDSIEDVLKIKDGETTEDGLFTLESVACLGCCSLAPVMMIGDETYGNLTQKSAAKIVRDIKRNEKSNS
ncbi:MAG: NADH-quinone oxidoreductase subunit NuoE [Bacteroidota bacterium]|nr:NADH-quinone oxidoreductase subunit NuoE [Bacteroidota bacterium]